MITNTRRAEIEARSRIMWGDSKESVLTFLQEAGFGDKDALAIIEQCQRERCGAIRNSAVKRIFIGVLLLLIPIAAYVAGFLSDSVSGRMMGFAIFFGLIGLWRIVDGTWRLLRPTSTSGDLANIEE